MRVCVTGAAGFLGGHTIPLLLKEDIEVRAVIRDPSKAGRLKGCETRLADVTRPLTLQGAFRGCDAVVHLVGIIRGDFHRVTYGGTRNVIEECKAAGVRKIVYVSALGTSGDRKEGYFRAKYMAEEYVRKSGLAYSILRPSVIYGPGGEFMRRMFSLVRKPVVPVFGDGSYLLQPVYAEDVGKCVLASLRLGGDSVLDIAGPRSMSFDEMLDSVASAAGVKARKAHIPLWLSKPLVAIMSLFPFTPITSGELRMLLKGDTCDIGEMVGVLGIDPLPFEEGLKKALSGPKD